MSKVSVFTTTLSFLSLMAFWVAMSGFFDAIHLSLGVVTVIGVLVFNHKLKSFRYFDDDMNDLKELKFGYAVYYVVWMLVQIVKSGFHVVRVILNPDLKYKTTLLTFQVDLPSAHAKMILGNSITLTPGTLTVEIQDDMFTVHALDANSYESILSDEMPRKVLKLFTSEERQVVRNVSINYKKVEA